LKILKNQELTFVKILLGFLLDDTRDLNINVDIFVSLKIVIVLMLKKNVSGYTTKCIIAA